MACGVGVEDMYAKDFQVAEIANQIDDHDKHGGALFTHMIECGFVWGEFPADHPDLTAEEIASAAACGFEVANG